LEKIFSRYYYGNKYQKLSKQEKEELSKQIQKFYITPPPTDADFSLIEGDQNKTPLTKRRSFTK